MITRRSASIAIGRALSAVLLVASCKRAPRADSGRATISAEPPAPSPKASASSSASTSDAGGRELLPGPTAARCRATLEPTTAKNVRPGPTDDLLQLSIATSNKLVLVAYTRLEHPHEMGDGNDSASVAWVDPEFKSALRETALPVQAFACAKRPSVQALRYGDRIGVVWDLDFYPYDDAASELKVVAYSTNPTHTAGTRMQGEQFRFASGKHGLGGQLGPDTPCSNFCACQDVMSDGAGHAIQFPTLVESLKLRPYSESASEKREPTGIEYVWRPKAKGEKPLAIAVAEGRTRSAIAILHKDGIRLHWLDAFGHSTGSFDVGSAKSAAPSIAYSGDTLWMAWSEDGQLTYVIVPMGAASGTPSTLSVGSKGPAGKVSVAAMDGVAVVGWSEKVGSDTVVRVARWNGALAGALPNASPITLATSMNSVGPRVDVSPDGRAFVAWDEVTADAKGGRLRLARLDCEP